jgi:hypothetical protein
LIFSPQDIIGVQQRCFACPPKKTIIFIGYVEMA